MKRFAPIASLLFLALSAAVLIGVLARPAAAQDPLKVAPSMYKLLYENERVRVMEVTFRPGEKIASHSHPDHVAYFVSGGKLKISKPDGTSSEVDGKTGDVLWIPAEKHWAENTGTSEVRVLVTELKEPAKAHAMPSKAPATPKK